MKKILRPSKYDLIDRLVEKQDGVRHPKHQPTKRAVNKRHDRDELIRSVGLQDDR